ncbi:MAG: RNA helicase [Synechococcaceae bacterium WBB_3_034]|nr:RNA helicase [Synechococcaceae bacterium WBB_3_034]
MRSDDDRWETRRPRRPRLDQWMTTGRQLVDGVAGTRPGSRGDGRYEGRSGGGLRLNQVGRWVETKLDWLLEDDDGWRESWEEPEPWRRPSEPRQPERQRPSSRTPLQAVSRRPGPGQAVPAPQDWPDADSFTLNRWSRADASPRPADPPPRGELGALDQAASRPPGRALPRSSRRRFDDPS